MSRRNVLFSSALSSDDDIIEKQVKKILVWSTWYGSDDRRFFVHSSQLWCSASLHTILSGMCTFKLSSSPFFLGWIASFTIAFCQVQPHLYQKEDSQTCFCRHSSYKLSCKVVLMSTKLCVSLREAHSYGQ